MVARLMALSTASVSPPLPLSPRRPYLDCAVHAVHASRVVCASHASRSDWLTALQPAPLAVATVFPPPFYASRGGGFVYPLFCCIPCRLNLLRNRVRSILHVRGIENVVLFACICTEYDVRTFFSSLGPVMQVTGQRETAKAAPQPAASFWVEGSLHGNVKASGAI